jgi:hypothetical protein
VFRIGKALNNQISIEGRSIMSSTYSFGVRVGPAQRAVAFFVAQNQAAKDAIRTWTLIAKRIASASLNKVL